MTDSAPSWDEILSAAEEELHAFESAISLFQARLSELRDAMTKKLYDELRRDLDKMFSSNDSAWDILVGIGINAAGGAIVAASTRLMVSNIMRGWSVMTTVRTAPIVFRSTSKRYASGMKAAQMLAEIRRSSMMEEITTPGTPLHDVNEDVVGLLSSAVIALGKNALAPEPAGQAADRPSVLSRPPRPATDEGLTPEAAKLRERMPVSTEQDRFTMALQEQHHKADLLLKNMRTIVAELEQDPDLDTALRKEWQATEAAIDELAGTAEGRIPPGSRGLTLDTHKSYLKLLYAAQWTNTVAFLQFGPSRKLGTIRPDAYKRDPKGPKKPFFPNNPNLPYRLTYPHWWTTNNAKRTAAYYVEGEGFETDIVSLKNAAAAEAMVEVLADPGSDYSQRYLEYAETIVTPKGPGLIEPGDIGWRMLQGDLSRPGGRRRKFQTLDNAKKDQAFQRMFRDIDETWLRLRVIPAAQSLLQRLADSRTGAVVGGAMGFRSMRDALDRLQQ